MNEEKPYQDLITDEDAQAIPDSREDAQVGAAHDLPSSDRLAEDFSRPFNWCDRRCERCPLARECPVNLRELQRRWVNDARHRDSDAMAVAMSDVEEELTRTLALVQEIASEEGIDLNAPLPPLPISLPAVKLRRAGLNLTVALHAALESPTAELPPTTPSAINDAIAASATLAAKCARIGSYLAEHHDDTWMADAVPNLLLMERLRASLDHTLTSLEAVLDPGRLDAVRAARRDLDRILDPLLCAIQPTARYLLAEIAARSAAPSPFSTVAPLEGAG